MKSSRTHLLIRQYLNEVKCLLPVLRREEIDYFQKMEANMYDLLENGDFEPPASMEDCHKIFGEPEELVHQYYSCVDVASYAASVNFRKMIRNIILSVFDGSYLNYGDCLFYVCHDLARSPTFFEK